MDASESEFEVLHGEKPTAGHITWLRVAISSSVLLLVLQCARRPLVNLLSVFIEPFLEIASYLTFLAVTVTCLVHGIRQRRHGWKRAWLPFLICISTVGAIYSVPFDLLYVRANFYVLKGRRTGVAKEVLAGNAGAMRRLADGEKVVSLPRGNSLLSDGGEVVVDHDGAKTFVLFFTFRGILERFSGYVYSPTDDPPSKTQFQGDGREIWRVAPNWFWYAS